MTCGCLCDLLCVSVWASLVQTLLIDSGRLLSGIQHFFPSSQYQGYDGPGQSLMLHTVSGKFVKQFMADGREVTERPF